MSFIPKKRTILSLLLLIPFFLHANPLQQEEKYSDEILEKFVEAVTEVIGIQEQSQATMIQSIEEGGMSVERYNALTQKEQQGVEIESEQEARQYATISGEIAAIQAGVQQMLIGAIEESGIGLDTYQAIIEDYQSDPALQQRIDGMMEAE